MVLDTSVLLAMLFAEPERDTFIARLAGAEDPVISAATLLEASIVMQARTGPEGVADLDRLLEAAGVRCVAVDRAQAIIARESFARFGGLNYGDCFAYALAKALKRPVLSKATP